MQQSARGGLTIFSKNCQIFFLASAGDTGEKLSQLEQPICSQPQDKNTKIKTIQAKQKSKLLMLYLDATLYGGERPETP